MRYTRRGRETHVHVHRNSPKTQVIVYMQVTHPFFLMLCQNLIGQRIPQDDRELIFLLATYCWALGLPLRVVL